MINNQFAALVEAQRNFLVQGITRDLNFRFAMLEMLESAIRAKESSILEALHADLGKPAAEAWASEIGFIYAEIKYIRRHLRFWSRSRRVATPLFQALSASRVMPTPYGVCLIIAPWNYPFQLVMAPLIAAVAGGNSIVIKPSEMAPATAKVLADLITEYFTPDFIAVVQGDATVSQALIEARPDHIFFTGSTNVGKSIMRSAAENLIPVVLELGGKSPCLVLRDANLSQAARRIAWGKFLNCGQTCVAPDYVLVDAQIKDRFIAELKLALLEFYAPGTNSGISAGKVPDIAHNPDYGRIINDAHFVRLENSLKNASVVFGGDRDRSSKFFAPTIVDEPSWDSPLLNEEIFGPILPILAFDELEDVLEALAKKPRPLAFYLFTSDRAIARKVMKQADFGGGCVNDTLVHFANPRLPFGGVGASGMGSYHGKAGFDAFTYQKSLVTNAIFPHITLRYPPYADKLKIFKRFM